MPNRVYALVEAPGELGGMYRSDDSGATWHMTTNEPSNLLDRAFYYTRITADPVDPDIVYVNNVAFWRSTDGGESFERRPTPHSDNHDIWIDPNDNQVMVQGNDGGANVSRDGGDTWSTQLNQPTAELYNVDVDDRFPYWLYSGQQDNSSIAVPSLPPTSWSPDVAMAWWDQIGGCETGPVVPKPDDENVVYANCKGKFGLYDRRSGQERNYWVGAQYIYGHNPKDLKYRLQRTTPIEVSPHDPGTVYYGSQFLHRTRDGGVNWETISPDLTANESDKQVISGAPITRDVTGEEFYSTIYAIAESPVQAGVIWVGSNDGPVHVTRDNGATWTDVTPPMPPGGRIQNIDPSPHEPGRAYVAAYRLLLNDWRPYIYRTDDYGQTWTLLTDGTNGIPADYPTRVVREDTQRPGLLYGGTEFGMYVSFDDGAHWQSLQLNLPHVPVSDLQVHAGDLVMATMGRGFYVLDDLAPLRQATAQLAAGAPHLYSPMTSHRMRYRGRIGDASEAQYIQAGAILDYVLPSADGGAAALEIVNSAGEVIRRIESASGTGERTEAGQGMQATQWVRTGTARLPAEAGHNRYVWDLTLPGPIGSDGQPGRGGPMIVPASYA
ncbi:MAG: WD40/YVTN/BNR-like repeat-containing protein, partial [Longimicrobiales bacterium]